MMTLSTWEAALWNVDWSSREGLKIFKAILLLKNPRGPERGRVSSALWLCCWRIAGDNLCISGSGPVKDSSPSPSRLCQKHRSRYMLFMLIPIQPIIPSFPDFTSLCWSNVFPSLQAQNHQHTLHDPSYLSGWCWAGAVHLQPGLHGISLFSSPKGRYKSDLGVFPTSVRAVLWATPPILSCCSELTQEKQEQHPNKIHFVCVCLQTTPVPRSGWHSRGEGITALVEQSPQTLWRVGSALAPSLRYWVDGEKT